MKMVKELILLTFIFGVFVSEAFAQASPAVKVPEVISASPEAASLGKYGDVPVGMFTGHPNVSIDLDKVSTKHLSIPIALNYNANGIKVNELSTNVGMSWSFNCGGVISRTVYGAPDFGLSSVPVFPPNLYFTPPNDGTVGWMDAITGAGNDTQIDAFSYNFGGYTGKFFIVPVGVPNQFVYKVVTVPYANIRIEYDFSGKDWNFKLTTPDGVIYYFGGGNATEFTESFSTCGNAHHESSPTAWYLVKIQHPYDLSDSLVLTYTSSSYYYLNNVSQTETFWDYTDSRTNGCGVDPRSAYGLATGTISQEQWCTSGSSVSTKYVQSITDGKYSQYNFDYVAKPDANGGFLLSHIVVSNHQSGERLRSFSFNYQTASPYSGSNNTTAAGNVDGSTNLPRPFLMEVDEFDSKNVLVKPYKFGYNDFSGLPPRLSFAQDYWGYFNGVTTNFNSFIPLPEYHQLPMTNLSLIANRNPDYPHAIKGLLNRVTYPTGGYTSIEYEGNTKNSSYGGAFASSSFTDAFTLQSSVEVTSTNTDQTFHVAYPMTVTIYASISCNCPSATGCPAQSDSKVYGTLTANFTTTAKSFNFAAFNARQDCSKVEIATVALDSGVTYGISILPLAPYQFDITINAPADSHLIVPSYRVADPAVLGYTAGGMRVKRVVSYDPISKDSSIKRYFYDSNFVVFPAQPTYYHHLMHYEQAVGGDACQVPFNGTVSAGFHQFSSNSLIDAFGQNSSPVYYRKVIESLGDNFENGGIEHNFAFNNYTPVNTVFHEPVYSATAPAIDWGNGLELQTTHFKMVGGAQTPVQKKVSNFQIDSRNGSSYPGYVIERVGNFPSAGPTSVLQDCFNAAEVNYVSQWQYLASDSVQEFDLSGNPTVATKTNYYYDNALHAQITRVQKLDSKGKVLQEVKRYPQDSTSFSYMSPQESLAMSSLVSQGRTSEVIEDETRRDTSLMARVHNSFGIFSNGYALPQSVQQQNGNQAAYTVYQLNKYDPNGNIISIIPKEGVSANYVWDYQSNYPIAQVKNADSGDIAYTSFEADGSGNWTIGASTRDTLHSITGTKSYSMNSDISKTGLTSSKTYIVSYWTKKASAFSITGTISGYPTKGKTINGWTLYVHKVTGQTTIGLSGAGLIDELRLYPDGAQMTTYTFQPLVGMTSQTDIGNRVTYYEYDGFQRLKRIRDQDYNIVKTYDYQYQAPAGCGTGCYTLAMQTFVGTSTIGYPVGVFDVHGVLLGNATGASAYVALWNNDTADSRIGTLSTGSDSLHFSLQLNTGMTLPAGVTGCRYYQVDMAYTKLDAVLNINGSYVDFGDGTGMPLNALSTDAPASLPASTTSQLSGLGNSYTGHLDYARYYIHTYPTTANKTITIYHNDATESFLFDNYNDVIGLTKLRNLRGNFPQQLRWLAGSSFQDTSMLTVANIANWNTIHSVEQWNPNTGDGGVHPTVGLNYNQDFMAGNTNLKYIITAHGYWYVNYYDASFKLSRLKNDWNTYFNQLQTIWISESHWNHEDLSGLTNLNSFLLVADNANHSNVSSGNTITPLSQSVIDSVIIQIADGAGKNIKNGTISFLAGGTPRSNISDAAKAALYANGWTIYYDWVAEP